MGKEINLWEVVRLLEDFKGDLKQLLSIISKNKNSISDFKKDFKKFLGVMEKLTKEENMRTFRKFVSELEKFNKNAERLSNELDEMKDILGEVASLVKLMKGD